MFRFPALAALLLTVAACASPEERCLRRAIPDYGPIDRQIAEAQANISRGYALKRSNVRLGLNLCSQSGPMNLCLGGSGSPPPQVVPIDVQAEKARLAALKAQRAEMEAASQRAMEACQTTP